MAINRISDFFLLVDKYRKLYKAITILSKHIQVTDGHYLENLQEGGEQFIIHKVQIPENNDVIICINEGYVESSSKTRCCKKLIIGLSDVSCRH